MRALAVLLLLPLCLPSRAQAQVSVDMRALDSMGAAPARPSASPAPRQVPAMPAAPVASAPPSAATAKPASAPPRPSTRPDIARPETARPETAKPEPTRPGAATTQAGGRHDTRSAPAAKPPSVALPAQPPPAAPLSTMVPVPAAPPGPPPANVRLVFPNGKTDLSPEDEAAIRGLARALPAGGAAAFGGVTVLAYAAGTENDPSTARRLSLSRGLAVRTVLMDSGIPSSQIYVRALGAAPDMPADRVELTVARPSAPSGGSPVAAPAAPAPGAALPGASGPGTAASRPASRGPATR